MHFNVQCCFRCGSESAHHGCHGSGMDLVQYLKACLAIIAVCSEGVPH